MSRIKGVLFVLFCVLWQPLANAQWKVDSLGKLWVVTVDLSGSMIPGINRCGQAPQTAKNVMKSLQRCWPLEQIDFEKDRFLFFTSGYLYFPLKKGEPGFDSCFIHHTDALFHSFAGKQELITHVGHLLDCSRYKYKYQLSFVSQIETFSLVKASRFLRKKNNGLRFKCIELLTITDDAEGTPQWRVDLRNIKFWDPQKLQEIRDITQHYVYNELTGTGACKINEVYYDDKDYIHIKVSDCQSIAARPQENKEDVVYEISARDGETVTLKFPSYYQDFTVALCYIDSLAINGKMFVLNRCYPSDMASVTLNIPYANENRKNHFEIFGKLQIVYKDPIFGEHYRQVYFSQQDEMMSRTMINHIVYIILAVVLSLSLVVWLLLFFLPRRKLLTLDAVGKKYEIQRGYRWDWKKTGTQLFAVRQGKSILQWGICAKVPMIKVAECPNTDNTVITICSSKDIDFEVNMRALGQSNLPLAAYECEKNYDRKKKQYCYKLKITGQTGFIAFRLPRVHRVVFIQIVGSLTKHQPSIIDAEYGILREYYELPPTKRSEVLVCAVVFGNDIAWRVLLPEYNDGVGMPLLRVRRLFSFCQKGGAVLGRQEMLAQLLISQVKKYQPQYKKIKYEFLKDPTSYGFIPTRTSAFQFEMIDAPCNGFICLREDTENHPHSQVLYSPMGDTGLQQEIRVSTPKLRTGKGFVYQTFLPFPILEKLPPENKVGLIHRYNQMISFDEARNYESVFFEKNTISYNIVQSKLIK